MQEKHNQTKTVQTFAKVRPDGWWVLEIKTRRTYYPSGRMCPLVEKRPIEKSLSKVRLSHCLLLTLCLWKLKVVYRTLIREKGLHISTTATTGYQFYFQFERTVIDLSFETELRHSPVLPRAMKATTTAASLDKVTHLRARQSPYPKSNQRRHHVPDSLIDWKVCKLVETNVIISFPKYLL